MSFLFSVSVYIILEFAPKQKSINFKTVVFPTLENEAKKPKKLPQKAPEKKVSTNEAGRVGERPYARGRSYQADRYEEKE